MAFALAIKKSFVLYKVLYETIQYVISYRILHIEKSFVISQLVSHTIK